MKIIVLTVFLFSYHICAYGIDNLRWADIRSIGMGINGVTQSFTYNPALVASALHKELAVDYFNRYTIKELGSINAGFIFPNSVLSTGVNISSFGYDDYRESLFRLSLGKELGREWFVGISTQFALLQSFLYDHSPKQLGVDVGLLYKPVENLFIGLLMMNCPSIKLNKEKIEYKELMSYYIQIGFQYKIINTLLIAGSAGCSKEDKFIGNIGIEYEPFDNFTIRVGVCSSPLLPTLGIGYHLSHFSINIAAVHHPVLGVSSGVGINYIF